MNTTDIICPKCGTTHDGFQYINDAVAGMMVQFECDCGHDITTTATVTVEWTVS